MRLARLIVVLALIGMPATALAAPHLVRTLPNKMKLVVRENRTRPLVCVQAWIKAGTRDEARGERGSATVLARMLFEATKTRPPGIIQNELSLYGGSYASEVGYGYTLLQVTVPARSLSAGLDLLSDIALRPRMDPKDLQQGITNARVESQAMHSVPEHVAISSACDALHPGTPLGSPLAASEVELAAVTLPTVRRFYTERYVAENMTIVVVGDVDPEDTARKVEAAFQEASKEKAPSRSRVKEKPLASTRIFASTNPTDTPGAAIAAAFRTPEWGSADAIALDVLMAVLVDSPTSRAQKRLVEGSGEFILATAQRSFEEDGGTVALSMRVPPERMRDAEGTLVALIEEARSTPVSQEELDAAVRSIVARDLFAQAELPGLARATGLASSQGRPGADEVYMRRLSAIRLDDLAAMASQYLDLKRGVIVETMTAGAADSLGLRQDLEKRIREKMGMHEAAHRQETKVSQSSEQERRKRIDAPLDQIPSTPMDAGRSRVDRSVVAGGLRVLTSEDRSVPLVTVGVYLSGGVRYENDANNGVTSLLREVILNTPDSKAGGVPYRQSLADLGRMQTYQDRDMWGVSLAVPATSWKDAVERLGSMFSHTDFDTISVDAMRLFVVTALEKWLDDEGAQRARLIFPTKYQISGYRLPGLGNRKNLLTMPLSVIEGWHRKFVVRGNVVVSVIGDVRPAEVGPVVASAFAGLSDKPFQPGTIAKEGEFEGFREKWELGGGSDCTVTLAFDGPPATSSDMPAMYVTNSLLSGPRGWFQQYLETNPFVKDASSVVSQAIDESPIIASVTVGGPVQEENVVKLLFRQFKKVAYLPLTGELADTLRYAKIHAVCTYLSSLNTNTSRSFQAGRDELLGLGVDNPVKFPAKIDLVTSADVERIGRSYFELDDFRHRPYAVAETRPGGW